MAADRKPEPPRSAAAWLGWEVLTFRQGNGRWIPQDFRLRNWPEGFPEGPGWFSLAEDHPFKGTEFCWRCIAEARQYSSFEKIPHRRTKHVICWGPPAADGIEQEQAAGHTDPEDSEPDTEQAESRAATDFADTGSFFWEGR